MPAPEDIAKYNMLYPRAAQIIFEGFKEQGEHRRAMESRHLVGTQRRSWGGLVAGWSLSVILCLGGGFLIYKGHDTAGASVICTNVAAVAGIFVLGRYSQEKERKERLGMVKNPSKKKARGQEEEHEQADEKETAL
jgi:uncharacterized membrane protein